MDVTYYTYNSLNDFPEILCRPASDKLTDAMPTAYPNPSDREVTIAYTLPAETRTLQLQVLNVSGQVVHRQTLTAQKAGPHDVSIALDGLVSGFYVFRLVSESGVQTGKFVKQ